MTPVTPRKIAKRITGPAHIFAASIYSIGGLRRLWRETAFRHEILGLVVCVGIHFGIGAPLTVFCVLLTLFLLDVAIDALKTAVECLADQIAPGWNEHARRQGPWLTHGHVHAARHEPVHDLHRLLTSHMILSAVMMLPSDAIRAQGSK